MTVCIGKISGEGVNDSWGHWGALATETVLFVDQVSGDGVYGEGCVM